MNLGDTLKEIADNEHEDLQKLLTLPFEKLYKPKKYYYDWYKSAEEQGYTSSAQVNYLHFSNICKAIEIKKGNEEEISNHLT
jgi:hypothetical protein